MIVTPLLAGLIALFQQALEGAAIGALLGALFGGAIAGGGEAITCFQEHGESNQACLEDAAESAGEGALEGAVGGAVTGGAFAFAGPILQPIFAVIDDFFRSIFSALDDVAQGVSGAIDDALTGIRKVADDIIGGIRGFFNRMRNFHNARNFNSMANAPEGTRYVYLMEDSANGMHKIGMTTKTPPNRLNKVASEAKSKLDYTCIIQTDKNSGLEGKLHRMFSDQKVSHPTPNYNSTEWFVLSAAQVAAACSH